MSFTNILVPYDGSDHAKEAIREAMKMVEGNTDASIHVLSLIHISVVLPATNQKTEMAAAEKKEC